MQDPQLVDVASLNPGKCFTCGSIQGPMVDTMVDTFDGRFYVCVTNCVSRWGALAGLSADLEQQLSDANEENAELARKLEAQQPFVDAVTKAARKVKAVA